MVWLWIGLGLLSVVLSFGAGMQSLRQTAVMLVPMLALEGIQQLICLIRTKKVEITFDRNKKVSAKIKYIPQY